MESKRKHSSDSEDSNDLDVSQREYFSDEEGGIRIDDIYIPPPPKAVDVCGSTGPRLIITKITNTNFKSYGGVRTLGPFNKNFNAIVGPNGSGKSNVVDSMLFVFGYRASKIRSKKLSVLLHKSELFPHVESCTVAVHFALINDQDENSEEEVPNSSFVISRTVHKDNTSYYKLNDSRLLYKEIAALLQSHGVDLSHHRFLILQGEVEQISLMKPKAQTEHDTGMLEYLEDIIGTTRYKEPLSKLEEKIEILTERRTEKVHRVDLARKEKDDFEEPMLEAVRFLKLENEIIKKKNFLFQRHVKQAESKIAKNEEKLAVFTEKENEMKENLKGLSEEKKKCEAIIGENNKKYESLTKRRDQFQESFNEANNRDVNLQAEMQNINKRRKKVIDLLREEKQKMENLEKIPLQNEEKITEYESRETQLSQLIDEFEAEKNGLLTELREETLPLQEQKETILSKLVDLQKNVIDTKSAFCSAESELKMYVKTESAEHQKLESMKSTLEETKQKLKTRSEQLRELKKDLPTKEKQYKESLTQVERIKVEESKLANELKVQRIQLEETRSSMQVVRNQGRVLGSLTQLKTDGRLPGLFGRLGDLGAIDKKYDVAVSTACGPLDNIVVDTVDTAQQCIQFLKDNDIGRATFIALDKQEHLRNLANTSINTPENIPRVFDLIRIEDERVRPAFYYALRDTLVANNIEQATRIAYGPKRYRVVTLKGELIETSGTMSGGGQSVLKGRMGQAVAVQNRTSGQEKVGEMETNLTALEQKLKEVRHKQVQLEDQVTQLNREIRVLKTDEEKFTIELQSLQQMQQDLTTRLKKQEQKIKECRVDQGRVKELELKVADLKKAYEGAESVSEEVQKKVDVIKKKIQDQTEKKMKGVNRQLKERSDMLEKCRAELVKLRVAIKTAERNMKKSREKIPTLEQEKADTEKKLVEMQNERKEIENDAAVMIEQIEAINRELSSQTGAFSEEKEKISELAKEINKIKSEKIELDQQISEVTKILKQQNETFSRLEIQIMQLQFHEIPDEEPETLRKYSLEELIETDTKHMEIELKREEEEVKKAKPNLTALEEYKRKETAYIQRINELEEITKKRAMMRTHRDDVRRKRQKEFHTGFRIISDKLKEMYQMITLGGDAELEMVDSYNPFAEGIVLNVRPPKKSWKNITNLSGGEKTLSSLSLVFALHYYRPSPLYFMDEIDAALDFKNVSIIGHYIKERTKNAQFIIVSLRQNMFDLADHLIGIYKVFDVTQTIAIKPSDYAAPKRDNNPMPNTGNKQADQNGNSAQTEDATSLFHSDRNCEGKEDTRKTDNGDLQSSNGEMQE